MEATVSHPATEFQHEVEATLRDFLAKFVRHFPTLESLNNVRFFIANVAEYAARKVTEETPAESQRGRPDAALFRAQRWLWDLCWDDLIACPEDPVVERTVRLLTTIGQALSLPSYPGVGKRDPRLVAIEYGLLLSLFTPLLKRQPAPSRRKIPAVTRGPLSGKARQRLLDIETNKLRAKWEAARRQATNTILSIPWWQEGREFWFDEAELSMLTPQKAALTVQAKNSGRSPGAVRDQLKEGRKLLSLEKLQVIEAAWKNRRHAPEVCQVLGCCSVLL